MRTLRSSANARNMAFSRCVATRPVYRAKGRGAFLLLLPFGASGFVVEALSPGAAAAGDGVRHVLATPTLPAAP
jgi:hypothetical protein